MKRLLFFLLLLGATAARAQQFYVPITGLNTITRFDASGNATPFTSAFTSGPMGVALDANGNVFVSTNDNRIEEFSPSGIDLGTFASTGVNLPMALAFDGAGNLYVANFGGANVQKFTPAGVGSVFASVIRPTGLAFDAAGNLYVSNYGNTIEEFSPTGASLGTFAHTGLINPTGLAFDSAGNLFVANNGTNTVEEFSADGTDLGAIAQNVSGPLGLTIDRLDNLYVVAARAATIDRITPEGIATAFAQTGFSPGYIALQSPPVLVNISTRLNILTGENILDSGFIITGPGTKQVLIRGLGPSLGSADVDGTLADPVLELHDEKGALVTSNDNWKDTQQSAIEATGIPPSSDAEAAIIATLPAGSYTVIEHGNGSGTGIGLMEIYDLTSTTGPELANISTRGFVGTGSDVMIAGFIVSATTGGNGNVLVRALGPSLGENGVAQPLGDPVLELRDSNGTLLASNDNWKSTQEEAIESTGVPPTNDAEAALLVTLNAGAYTAVERGQNGGTGVGLIEVYNLH